MSASISAREAILGRVRSAIAGTEQTSWEDVARHYRQQRPAEDLVGLFCERVADYRATVERVAPGGLTTAIVAAAHTAGARRVLAPAGVPHSWYEALTSEFAHVDDGTGIDTAGLERVDAVITTAVVGIASTGTIVLDHGPGQGHRAVTLVPDVHICVVAESQVADDVPDGLRRLDPARPMTFISGPSATSDIELKRVEGVHGPRTLHVLVTPDEP
ncbi:L-lactate dehydrogenase complex protein LldG [Saccharopolyspora antimicrobica]|uniref:L-lactate dehydrogenase complex protein LldG n=1 Tax=Saccharopolyspora antimicrobica TaxID=455193 RepID=A0A1I4RQE9_9PSEU|nr:lactate utilization protein C [Saccharopolyspora antimicrobica]RKT87918.1 L-lactate dehydrogenase complex protein LldG [Saccharopolyspora antimicrobica]SFM54431.1 L-lactate dehydrogenase complex protein LldG [Saccharopolyspora antimicrobica]